MSDLDYVSKQVAAADAEAVKASWSFGMDITNLRPGAWAEYMNRRYDEILAGVADGGGSEPIPDPGEENSGA